MLRICSFVLMCMVAVARVNGATVWTWSYSGDGIVADGRFTTGDVPDANGGYLITAITGTRNGSAITSLQAPGTAIPGNEPFAVDDLIFAGPGPQLTSGGFGFGTADGNFSNPFYADFLQPPTYLEFFSTPPFNDGGQGPNDSELPIEFSASPTPEPTPGAVLAMIGAAAAGWRGWRKYAKRVRPGLN